MLVLQQLVSFVLPPGCQKWGCCYHFQEVKEHFIFPSSSSSLWLNIFIIQSGIFSTSTLLCIVQCSEASLVSTHQMLVVPTPPLVVKTNKFSRHCPTFSRGQNCPWLRTTGLKNFEKPRPILSWQKKKKEKKLYSLFISTHAISQYISTYKYKNINS